MKVPGHDEKYASVARTNTWKKGKPTPVSCPDNWRPGAQVVIRVLTRVPLETGGFDLRPEPRAEKTIIVHDPKQDKNAVLRIYLLQRE